MLVWIDIILITHFIYKFFYFIYLLQTAEEWERRRENFIKELDFVIADVVWLLLELFLHILLLKKKLYRTSLEVVGFFFLCLI